MIPTTLVIDNYPIHKQLMNFFETIELERNFFKYLRYPLGIVLNIAIFPHMHPRFNR